MKTLRLYVLWLSVVACFGFLAGCGSDDEGIVSDNLLLGTWVYKDASTGYKESVTFNADGSCKMVVEYTAQGAHVSTKLNATYTYEDDIITIIPENGTIASWKVYSVTAKTLTLVRHDVEGQPSLTYHRA